MSDLHGGSEEMSRADKISRIKNSMRPENTAPKAPETPAASDWEQNLARILAKKEQKPKSSGSATAESILAEIYGDEIFQRSPERNPISTPEPEVITKPEIIPEPKVVPKPEVILESKIVPEPEVIPEPEVTPNPEIISETAMEEISEELSVKAEAKETFVEKETSLMAASEKKDNKKKNKTDKKKKDDISLKSGSKKKKKKKKKSFKQRFLGLFPQKGDSVLEIIRKIVFLISIIAIVVCGYMVADYYIDLWQSRKVNEETRDLYWTYETTEPPGGEKHPAVTIVEEGEPEPVYTLLPGAKKLLDINSDVIGYIKVDGTPIDNVVLRGKDNFEYLDKKINGDENRAGELFLDWRNYFDEVDENGHLKMPNSQNLVIYGHAMKDESMFGCLIKYRNTSDYYSDHPIIHLNSNYSHYTYKIFAIFILDSADKSETRFDCWNKLNFSGEEDFYDFVNEAKRRTIRTNDVDVKYGDQILTLSTCDDYLGDRGRLIIMARQVREGEDAKEGTQNSKSNPNIKWPTMYYNTKSGEHYNPDDFVPYNAPAKKEDTQAEKTSVSGAASGPEETTKNAG